MQQGQNNGPVYIFAGGGTGGHLAPAVAVAEVLGRMQPEAKVLFACTNRAIDGRILEPTGYGMLRQPVRPIPRNPLKIPGFLLAWGRSLRVASRLLDDVRPAAVLGLGGFAAGPVVRTAAGMGIRCGLLNPDAVPGKANRYLAGRVEAIFTQFSMTEGAFARNQRGKVRLVGCPIRPSLVGCDRAASLGELGLRPDLRTLLVMGGSLGAESINQAVLGWMDGLIARSDRWQVLHISGPGKSESVGQAYSAGGVHHVVLDFCNRMGAAYAAADLAVGRAGANTVAELAATGTPGVLLPYPYHRDQHQKHNAAAMLSAGAADVLEDAIDPAVNSRRLGEALARRMDDAQSLAEMAAAAGGIGSPDAAETVAKWLMEG